MESLTLGFLQPYLNVYVPWLYQDSYWWTAFGLAAAFMFSSRFVVQWWCSERSKTIVVPEIFWHLSFYGSVVQLIYVVHVDKLPLILGYFFMPIMNWRNLKLMYRSKALAQTEGKPV